MKVTEFCFPEKVLKLRKVWLLLKSYNKSIDNSFFPFSHIRVFIANPQFDMLLICDALPDLVQFAQFKEHEKHPWRSVAEACNLQLY